MSRAHDEPKWRRYLRFHRPDPVADLDDELHDHIDSTTESLVAQGMSPTAAHDEALRRFGNLPSIRDEVARMELAQLRRNRWTEAVETFVQDVRFAARGFMRSPGLVVVAVVSIALAVAANTTVFSVVNALLLRPIPGAHADRLVRVYVNHHSPFSWQDLSWIRDRARSFDGLVGERGTAMSFRSGGVEGTERVRTSLVTRGFFTTLGARTILGRTFEGDERGVEAGQPVVVLSHDFWRRRFGGDSAVVGRVVTLSGHPVTIVGVAEPAFRTSFLGWTPELFVPIATAPLLMGVQLEEFGGSLYATARLKPGVDADAASSELQLLMTQLARTDTARYERMTLRLDHTRGVNAELRDATTAGSAFVLLMVGVVLLIACANVANLLLGRAASRQSEIGIRLALGASRARIVRQLLTESLLLAVLGTLAGLLATLFITQGIIGALPAEAGVDRAFFAPDHRVLLFTAGTCLATTLLFGLVPALRAASPGVLPMMKAEASLEGRRRGRGRLVAVQVALCVLTLAVASLFWRSLQRMRGVDNGFRTAGIVDVNVDLALAGGDEASQQRTFARVLERAKTLPGVQSATLAGLVPLSGSNMETRVAPQGVQASTRFDLPATYFNVVSPGYFETLGIPLHGGRGFLDGDHGTSTRVAVVNETAAARWWPGQPALGKRLRWGGEDGPELLVVGIARDAAYNMPGEEPKPFVYVPLAQHPRADMTLQLHTSAGIGGVRDAVWQLLRDVAPTLPPPPVTRITDDMALTLLPVRTGAFLLSALGVVALLLAASGIYGVTAYAVARRTREIGIRAALGAVPARLVRMVVGDSLRPVRTGLVVGLSLALLAAFGLSRVLYGVRTVDPVVLPGVLVGLVVVAAVASLVPAWRAARVDPTIAMRSE